MAQPHIATRFQHPVESVLYSREFGEFGFYINGEPYYHLGDDYEWAGEVYPIANGYVIDSGFNTWFGNYIIIEHTMPNGDAIYSLYAHFADDTIDQRILDADYLNGDRVKVSIDQDWELGIAGESGDADGIHLHLEIADQNFFNQAGNYGKGYDAGYSPAIVLSGDLPGVEDDVYSPGKDVYDPSDFIDAYDTIGAVLRDFRPSKNSLPPQADNKTPSTKIDFDSLFSYDTDALIFDGLGYFGDTMNAIDGFTTANLFALHTPSYLEQDGGYVNGTTSGSWVAFNGGGSPAYLYSADEFDFNEATFTAAWRDGLELIVIANDLQNGEYVEVGQEVIVLNTDDPIRWIFGNDFHDIEMVSFETSGGTQDPSLLADGLHFVMDDVFVFA